MPCHAPTQRYQKALRVAEMNTISNNGLRGVSDTMSGALWALDAAMEVAATGATGVNFHCGCHQSPNSPHPLRAASPCLCPFGVRCCGDRQAAPSRACAAPQRFSKQQAPGSRNGWPPELAHARHKLTLHQSHQPQGAPARTPTLQSSAAPRTASPASSSRRSTHTYCCRWVDPGAVGGDSVDALLVPQGSGGNRRLGQRCHCGRALP